MLNTGVKRSFRNFNSKAFERDLKRINWNEALRLFEKNLNLSFKSFLNRLDRSIDKHGPKSLIPETKPWITPALSSPIKIKNRVCKQFYK